MTIDHVLLIEPEEVLRQQLRRQLQEHGCVVTEHSHQAAQAVTMAWEKFDLILIDVAISQDAVCRLIQSVHACAPFVPVVVISEFGSVESAVECVQQGAFGFLLKPFSGTQLEAMLGRAGDFLRLVKVNQLLSRDLDADGGWELIGESEVMQQLRQTIRQVARTDATVLVCGESGTGKERIARAIWAQSRRAGTPLLKADCSDKLIQLLAVDLFGQETGTATGFVSRSLGRIELAYRGTLLLDEVSEISSAIQARLLRLLQGQCFERIGGKDSIKTDVRILATTSRNLEEKVQRGEFREDLFLRLNIVPVAIPPLRERKSDLPLLAEHFRQRFARRHVSSVLAISPACLAMLHDYSWPGNVRELKNVIERAVLSCREGNILEPTHLDFFRAGGHQSAVNASPAALLGDVPDTLKEMEKRHILAVLEKCHGNRTHAAKRLGVSIRTLRNKLREFRLESQQSDGKSQADPIS